VHIGDDQANTLLGDIQGALEEERLVGIQQFPIIPVHVGKNDARVRALQILDGHVGHQILSLRRDFTLVADDSRHGHGILVPQFGHPLGVRIRDECQPVREPKQRMPRDVEPEGLLFVEEHVAVVPLLERRKEVFFGEHGPCLIVFRAVEEAGLVTPLLVLEPLPGIHDPLEAFHQLPSAVFQGVEGAAFYKALHDALVDLAEIHSRTKVEKRLERSFAIS